MTENNNIRKYKRTRSSRTLTMCMRENLENDKWAHNDF